MDVQLALALLVFFLAEVRNSTILVLIGFMSLSKGYSYKTNQYGLSVDSVTEMELVLPNGQVKTITPKSDSDLFFALRGGGNNFVAPYS